MAQTSDFNAALADLEKAVRDGAYTTIGLGVLGFQRAQVARRELIKSLQTSSDQVPGLAEARQSVETHLGEVRQAMEAQLTEARHAIETQLPEWRETVEGQLGGARELIRKVVGRD